MTSPDDAAPPPWFAKRGIGAGDGAVNGQGREPGHRVHVAVYQAGIVIRDVLGEAGPPCLLPALPRVTFTDPEVGAVGLTEAGARESLGSVRVGIAEVPTMTRGWIHKVGNEGLIKLVEDTNRGVLVGATAMGPPVGEVIGAPAVAVHAEVPVEQLRSMTYAYPTFHRGIEEALSGWQ